MKKPSKTSASAEPFLERMIGLVSPGWAARRSKQRLLGRLHDHRSALLDQVIRMEADAAKQNRTTGDWITLPQSADSSMLPYSDLVDARARDLVRSTWLGESCVSAYRRHVVGTGLTPKAAARDPRGKKEFREYNRALDALWRRWASDPSACDVEGKKTLTEIFALSVTEFITVGEAILVKGYQPHARNVGLTLQMIEPEQLDAVRTVNEVTGYEVRSGIEINEYGRAVAYWIHTGKHPLEGAAPSSTRIEADRVIHFMQQRRVRQTHGESRLVSVIAKAREMALYDKYMVLRAKGEACVGAIITKDPLYGVDADDIGLPKTSTDDGLDANGADEIIWEPGMSPRLSPGEDVKFTQVTSPGNIYAPFTETQAKQVAAGSGLDYQTIVRDFTKGTFSGLRQGSLEFDKEVDALQQLVINLIGQNIREAFIRWAILENRLAAPGFWDYPDLQEAYYLTVWRGPAKKWIDPANQAAAAASALEHRLTTHRDQLAELDLDWREVFEQVAEEEQYARELKIRLPSGSTSAPAAIAPESGDADPPDEGAGDEDGDEESADEPQEFRRGMLHRREAVSSGKGN